MTEFESWSRIFLLDIIFILLATPIHSEVLVGVVHRMVDSLRLEYLGTTDKKFLGLHVQHLAFPVRHEVSVLDDMI